LLRGGALLEHVAGGEGDERGGGGVAEAHVHVLDGAAGNVQLRERLLLLLLALVV
jgi:hypothetical protein